MTVWDDFLANPDVEKVMLIDVKAYVDGSGEETFYLSTKAFTTSPSDSPANIIYDNKLVGTPYFTRRIPEVFYGNSVAGFGEITIDNSEGDLDGWLSHGWDGRDITIRLGNSEWAYTDFQIILEGKIERLVIDSDTKLRLEIRDKQKLLDVAVQSNVMPSTSPDADAPVPLCFGECFNVHAVQYDPTTLTYQVHDGAINDITAVYDNGVALTLSGDACATGGYTKNNATGQFTLCNAPAGDITADVQGAKPSTYLVKPGEIIREIVTRSNGVGLSDPSDLDTASFTTMDTDCTYTLGLYITDRRNCMDVLDDIVKSCGGYYGFTRDGLFQVGLFDVPATSTNDLQDYDTVGDLNTSLLDIPTYRVWVGYKKNWYLQDGDGLAGAVTTARRGFLETEYRSKRVTDSSVLTKHLLARYPERYDTMISNLTDATTEANRLLTMWKTQRLTHKLTAFTKPFDINLGDTVTITDERYGMSAGVDCVVYGLTEYFVDNRVELELFR